MNNYEDIIDLPRHVSKTRKPMSLYERSAQFALFAALTGYDDEIKETARLTDKKIEIDDGLRDILNNKLNIILKHISEKPEVSITYFVPDNKKKGGKYITITGVVRKIDISNNLVIMLNKEKIEMNDILNITSDIFI